MRLSQYYSRVEFDGRRGRPTIRGAHVDYRRTIYRGTSTEQVDDSDRGSERCQTSARTAD